MTQESTGAAAREMGSEFKRVEAAAMQIATALGSGTPAKEDISISLKSALKADDSIFGLGAAYHTFAYDAQTERFCPYFIRQGEDILDRTLPYDYTQPGYTWYEGAKAGKTGWYDVWGEASQALLALYSVPIVRKDESFAGSVLLTYTFEQIDKWVADLDLGKTGFGFIISDEGHYIVHPNKDNIRLRKNFFEQVDINIKEELAAALKKGERGMISSNDDRAGNSWMFYEPIPSTTWYMCVLAFESDILVLSRGFQENCIAITALATFSLLLLVTGLLFKQSDVDHPRRLWRLSGAVSLILVFGIIALWTIAYVRPGDSENSASRILNRYSIEKMKSRQREFIIESEKIDTVPVAPPVYIPTGVFLQSMEFDSAFNVNVTGYVWQKYTEGIHDHLPMPNIRKNKTRKHQPLRRGFVLPEAVSFSSEEAYTRWDEDHSTQTIGWYFEATLRQPFDYSNFPFDHDSMWLRLWHQDFDKNVILVPDLDAYETTSMSARPGLERAFVVSGWNVEGSFFDYKTGRYNSNFGIDDYIGRGEFPELHFNIAMKRHLSDAFISHVIPIAVVLFMIFAILLTTTPNEENASKLGSNAFGVLGTTSALFFVALLAHIQLRSAVQVMEITYLEYIYFVTYGMILLISIYSLLVAPSEKQHSFVLFGHGIIAKLIYWPIVLGTMFVISLVELSS